MANPTAGQRPQRMFCIKEGKVILAEPGMALSHREWFERQGWIGKDGDGEEERFFHHVISGSYLPDKNELYCYREIDFAEDPEVIDTIVHYLAQLKKSLELRPKTKVFIGPCGEDVHGADGRAHYAGTIDELVKYVEKLDRTAGRRDVA